MTGMSKSIRRKLWLIEKYYKVWLCPITPKIQALTLSNNWKPSKPPPIQINQVNWKVMCSQ